MLFFFLNTLSNLNKIFFSYAAFQTSYNTLFSLKYASLVLLVMLVLLGFF